MRKNRTMPYGYQVTAGATSVNELEADVVRRVFREYAAGHSYKAIAEALTQSGSRYTHDKPIWNKNIIARMLQNQLYLGTEHFPPLLTKEEYQMAQEAKKPYTLRQAPELKSICGMLVCGVCGAPIKRRNKPDGTERWYCEADYHHIPTTLTDAELLEKLRGILAHMTETPEKIISEPHAAEYNDIAIARLESEINAMLDRAADNTEEMLDMFLRLAADKYASVSGVGVESKRIKETVKCRSNDIRILSEIADSITISPRTVLSISLKNGQNILEGELDI